MAELVHTERAGLSAAIRAGLPQRPARIGRLLASVTALGWVLSGAPAADAGTFTVTSAGDPGASGVSLRQAIASANADSGSSFVLFDASLAGSTITLAQGQIPITRPMAIVGLGADKLTVSGNLASSIFSMKTNNAAQPVTVSGLTLTNSVLAIYARNSSLIVQDSVLSGNLNSNGGGASVLAAYSSNNTFYAYLDHDIIASNNATAAGKALYLYTAKGRFTSCTISNNIGTAVRLDLGASLSVSHSMISSNTGPGFIGLNSTHLTISDSSIIGNSSASGGGGISVFDTPLTILDSTIHGNSTGGDGGGILLTGNPYRPVPGSSLYMARSSVSGNSAYDLGGGLAVKRAFNVSINSSTFNDNQLTDFSAGANGGGIGLQVVTNDTTIYNSTVYHNFAYNSGGGIGIFDATTGNLSSILNTTIVKNATFGSSSNGIFGAGQPQLVNAIVANNGNSYAQTQDLSGSFSVSYSLIKNASAATISGNSNITDGTDPLLGPLTVNGGPTLTMLPSPASPVLDAGREFGVPQVDQRGLPRLVGAGLDMGAVERQNPEVMIFRNGFDSS